MKNLQRKQLDNRFRSMRAKDIVSPPDGWIKTIRKSLGMSGAQLASRAGLSPQRLFQIEKSEISGSINLKTLKKIADALNCNVKVALVPKTSLEEMVKGKAREVANALIHSSNVTMSLENQATSKSFQRELRCEIERNLISKPNSSLWD